MGSEYFSKDDPAWAEAEKAARLAADKANAAIAARCRDLGIPKQFAPCLHTVWAHRGYDNMLSHRREELRRMATTQIEAIERKAITEIEMSCLDAQTQLATSGLTSQAAKAFIEAFPSIDRLMQPLSLREIAGEAEPPIAEQLVSPNALGQRRYRERQAALRGDVTKALQAPRVTPEDDASDGGEICTASRHRCAELPTISMRPPTRDPGGGHDLLRQTKQWAGAPLRQSRRAPGQAARDARLGA